MTAIERLRDALDASDMAREYELEHEALAAVDALYQAAKAIHDHIEENYPETYWSDRLAPNATQSLAWIRQTAAAAVHRVDGEANG